jgi:hypothetical protein
MGTAEYITDWFISQHMKILGIRTMKMTEICHLVSQLYTVAVLITEMFGAMGNGSRYTIFMPLKLPTTIH